MSLETFKIETLDAGASARALDFYEAAGFSYREYDRVKLIESMESGVWTALMAVSNGVDIGGFYINWEPKYHLYRRLKLPELQDLRVLAASRHRGVGTALVTAAEELVRGRGFAGMGISVGLNADYGAAQRLYVRLGYMPDGHGVTYDREPVAAGERKPIDDDLALMLLKYF